MNLFDRLLYYLRSTISKVSNIALIVIILFGYMPMSAQGAEVQRQAELCQRPSAQHSIFLPNVSNNIEQMANHLRDAVVPQSAVKRSLAYEIGKTYHYEYEVIINTSSSKRDATGVREDGSEKMVIYAMAELSITGQEDDGTFVGQIVLNDPFICNTDGTVEGKVEDAETINALSTPLLFKQDPSGLFTAVLVPQGSPAQSTNIQKGVLNALQVTLKEENSYTALEDIGQGMVNTQYAIEEKVDGLHITKTFNRQSFANLLIQGPASEDLILQNTIKLVLGRNHGVISQMSYTEKIASGDGKDSNDGIDTNFNGVTVWSTAESTGSITLKQVTASEDLAAASLNALYVADSLGATLVEDAPNRKGIDLSEIDLDAAFANLETDPINPDHHAYLLALVDADDGNPHDDIDVLRRIEDRLLANVVNTQVANAYVDLLGTIGTLHTQEMLSAILGNIQAGSSNLLLAPFSEAVREQALINIAILDSPTITTVNTVQGIVSAPPDTTTNSFSNLHETAVSVLGAVANNLLDENPDMARALAEELARELKKQQEAKKISLYLDALGNAGHPSSLDVIKQYTNSEIVLTNILDNIAMQAEAIDIQVSALGALRKIPGNETESLLLASLTNQRELDVVHTIVANILSVRNDLSAEGTTILAEFVQRELASSDHHDLWQKERNEEGERGKWNRNWNYTTGNSDLGVAFPGGTTLMIPPAYDGFYVYAYQKADALIIGQTFSMLNGELRTHRLGEKQVFGAYLTIGGNLIRRQHEEILSCGASRSGTLFGGTLTFMSASFRIPVYAGITLGIDVKATGSFDLTYELLVNACNLQNLTASARITPRAWATAEASANLSIVLIRVGATLSATLLQTAINGGILASYDAVNNNDRFCVYIAIVTQPLSGNLSVWLDVRVPAWRIPPWKWKRVANATLWRFSSPLYTYSLLNQCNPDGAEVPPGSFPEIPPPGIPNQVIDPVPPGNGYIIP